jgi:hypothetical protein
LSEQRVEHAERSEAVGSLRKDLRWLLWVIVASGALGANYIYRTSIEFNGVRYFVLWDDAMISMQYAKNFVEGHGLVWSAGGDIVQGFTNLGVTLMMSVVHLFPIEPEMTSAVVQAINLVALLSLVVVCHQLSSWGLENNRASRLLAATMVAFCFPLHVMSLQGSDTGFIGLWLIGCHLIYVRTVAQNRGDIPWLLFTMLAIGPVLRMDSLLYVVPLLLGTMRLPGATLPRLVLGALPTGAVVAGVLAFGFFYYGDPLPNTFYLKATGQPRDLMLQKGFEQLQSWFPYWLPAFAFAGVASVRHWKRPGVQQWIVCIALAVAYHVWVGGDLQPAYGSRFLVPVLPFLLVLAAEGAVIVLRPVPLRRSWVRQCVAAGICAMVLLISNSPTTNREMWSNSTKTLLKSYTQRNIASAIFFREHTDPSSVIALHWAGLISYFADRPVKDVLGKSDRHIARMSVDVFSPGHSKWDWDYVVETMQPDIVARQSRGLTQVPKFRENYLLVKTKICPQFYIRRDRMDLVRYAKARFEPIP